VHYPNYALGELLATFCDSPTEQNSLLSDMRRLVSRIIESEFMSSREIFAAPEFSQQARSHYSRRIQFRDPRIADLQSALDGDPSVGLISVLSLSAEAWREPDVDPELSKQLASTLNILGTRLSNLGRREEALVATQEAVDIRRRLAAARPDALLPELASSLNNLGNRLSELDRREEALVATQEAVDIYRRLAAAGPDAFLPYLASSLNNLGIRLSQLGRREEALVATQEAVDIRRTLAAARPDAFLPDLAGSLNNLGKRLSELGRREEALAAAQEGIQLFTPLFLKHPQAHASQMAPMRRVYLSICELTGRVPDEALLTPINEALRQMDSGSDA
jgi:tetratricopeptide (TPR) repeat protein